jgi:hypothetical protein
MLLEGNSCQIFADANNTPLLTCRPVLSKAPMERQASRNEVLLISLVQRNVTICLNTDDL